MPVCIIKDPRNTTAVDKGRPYRFGVCFDTSKHAEKTLRQVLSMMADHDLLVTISVREPGGIDEAKANQQIDAICKEFGKTPEKKEFLDQEACPNVYERVKEFLMYESTQESYIDFLGVGNRGIHKKEDDSAHMGSMATMALRNKRLNLIFVPCD